MDHKFTEKVQAWLNTPADERDNDMGALYLLQLSSNQIMYRNISRNTKKNAEFIEYNIRKYMKFRLADLTHEQVTDMQKSVDRIVALRHLDKEPATASAEGVASIDATGKTVADNAPADSAKDFKAGKRPDHDSLPIEIQSLYVENGNILHKMRELHMQLRALSTANATCPDSERYPFLKELIELDKQYHKNWQVYDSWSAEKAAEGAEQKLIEDERQAQRNIYRQINLTKGRYKKALKARAENGAGSDSLPSAKGLAKGKNPTDSLKEQIATLYSQLASPVETLTAELCELGVLPADYSPKDESSTVEVPSDTASEDAEQ